MSSPFVGEIKMFAGNFPPRSYAFCDGQLLAISQNDALFSLLGTIYGGDGRTTFGLPDLRGRVPIHRGQGPGLANRTIGSRGGSETVTLAISQIPQHNHLAQLSTNSGTTDSPTGNFPSVGVKMYRAFGPNSTLQDVGTTSAGGSQAHTNLMPTQCINFIIALFGIYPSRP